MTPDKRSWPGIKEGNNLDRGKNPDLEGKHEFDYVTSFEQLDSPRSFMTNKPEVMCRRLGGGIELIWVDQGCNEAYINPFVSFYFSSITNSPAITKEKEELRKQTQIFACVPRRVSKEHNEPIHKESKDSNDKYKKCYLVRLAERGAKQERNLHQALKNLCQVSDFERDTFFPMQLRIALTMDCQVPDCCQCKAIEVCKSIL